MGTLFIGIPLFLLPINLFDGEIVYKPRPLSLHFVSGLEYGKNLPKEIADYYLTPKGYIFAVLFILGIPSLLAYRIKIGQQKKLTKK
jgi:hypothetical protein